MSCKSDSAEVTRATLAFDINEDRVSLRCLLSSDAVVVLWLTARLARKLVPHLRSLIDDLPSGSPAIHGPAADEEAAEPRNVVDQNSGLKSHETGEDRELNAPVLAEPGSASWVVTSIDVTNGPMLVRLCFRNEREDLSTLLSIEHTQLARWLDGLRQCYVQAGWSMECWEEPAAELTQPTSRRVLMH